MLKVIYNWQLILIIEKAYIYNNHVNLFTMKRTFTSILFSLIFIFVVSQTNAQQAERLKSDASLSGPSDSLLTLRDSIVYFYSGARSIDSFFLSQEYDSSYFFSYQPGTGYSPIRLYRATYDADNNILSDTTYLFDTMTGTFNYLQLSLYGYINTRFPNKIFTLGYSGGVWDTGGTAIREYNNAGQVTYELSLSLTDTTAQNFFSYTPSGSYSSVQYYNYAIGMPYAFWYSDSYDSLGREDTSVNYFRANDTTAWRPQQMTVFYYDSTGYLSYEYTYNADSSGWGQPYKTSVTYDSHHNPTQYIYQGQDSTGQWINISRSYFAYDSFDMKTLAGYNDYWDAANGGSWPGGGDVGHLHYELYDLPTGIATIEPQADLRIYPVPAADMLSLDVKWQEAQAATAAIYDASGRKYTEWQLPNTISYHAYIPVSALPTGVYTLQIKGSCGTVSRSFDVMR